MNKLLNLILSSDSYKASQWLQYPPDTTAISSYIESRGGNYNQTVFFGLQVFLEDYLSIPITKQDVEFAKSIIEPHGLPFNYDGWMYIVDTHQGRLPLKIEAVPEGTVMTPGNVQVQVVNTDPKCFWLTSYIETALLRAVWYPSTVATISRAMKKVIANGLKRTSDILVADQLPFKLHDFGARGATSQEAAILGGMAHLVNFKGTDTMEALVGAQHYYQAGMAGFSIPASEHSTITSWGDANEQQAFKNMIDKFGGPGKIYACVSDSYNIWNAVDTSWPQLKDDILGAGGTLVVRPDSGDPLTVPVEVVERLMDSFGHTINRKGYRVLPPYIRVIQGDGINTTSLPQIVDAMIDKKLSLDNIAFGMGGGLLQNVNRDTLKYAMKASARKDQNGVWHDVYKDPIDGGKKSKKGRLGLLQFHSYGSNLWRTVPEEVANDRKDNMLKTVFLDGEIVAKPKWDDIVNRANQGVYNEHY